MLLCMPSYTSLRLTTGTRERLAEITKKDFAGKSADEVLLALIDEHWKNHCIEQADRWREDYPGEWSAHLDEMDQLDQLYPNLNKDEGPYRSDDPSWTEAGGLPLTETKDAA